MRILILVYCKALVEICALKAQPCLVAISGAQEPMSLGSWSGRAGLQDPPVVLLFAMLWTFQNHGCCVWVFPFCLSGESVRYRWVWAEAAHGSRPICGQGTLVRTQEDPFSLRTWLCRVFRGGGCRGDLARPRCSWLVTCSACVLAATLTAQTELQQSLPDVCAGVLSMQKHLVLERVPLHAELLMYVLLLIDLQKWRKKKQPRFENKTSVVDL